MRERERETREGEGNSIVLRQAGNVEGVRICAMQSDEARLLSDLRNPVGSWTDHTRLDAQQQRLARASHCKAAAARACKAKTNECWAARVVEGCRPPSRETTRVCWCLTCCFIFNSASYTRVKAPGARNQEGDDAYPILKLDNTIPDRIIHPLDVWLPFGLGITVGNFKVTGESLAPGGVCVR